MSSTRSPDLPQVPLSDFARRQWPDYPPLWKWLLSTTVFFIAGSWLIVIWQWYEVQKIRALTSWPRLLAENQIDFRTARAIGQAIHNLLDEIPPTNDLVPGAIVHRELAIGELARHFDSQTVGSITGWLQHSLRGWGSFSATTHEERGLGLLGSNARDSWTTGASSGVLVGTSLVNLNINAISRDDLFTEGFIAVFEERAPDRPLDTLRLIVPAEPACRAFVMEACEAIGRSYGEGSHRHSELRDAGATLRDAFKTDISYVSDRLNAVLRMEPASRPTVTVVDSEITEHALLGGAVQFSDKPGEWYQLFPLGLLHRLREIVAANGEPAEELPPTAGAPDDSRIGTDGT